MSEQQTEGITILHLSDIHRTPDEPVSNQNILDALLADLKRQQEQEGLPPPDLLVVSGDLTQSAQESEYNDAYNVIDRLKDELTVPDFSHVILVPGNHDINWDTSESIFKSGRRRPSGVADALLFTDGQYYFWTDEETYAQRLGSFRELYRRIYKREYGIARRDQYDIWAYPDWGICFVGLNSCDQVDHFRFQGGIYPEALFAANEHLRAEVASTDLSGFIKIAVWHHDLNWLGHATHGDYLDPSILGHLVDAEYDLAVCGHSHRTNFGEYTYPGFRLPVVSAGSLCAGARQRDESIPRLYNLIHIQANTVRVHTRNRETQNSPWRPYAYWSAPPRSYFDIQLSKSLLKHRQGKTRTPTDVPKHPLIPNEYYLKLMRDNEYLDISGVDSERAIPLKLSEVYVRLRVIPNEDDIEQEEREETEEAGSFDIHTALKRYRRLVIVGDPGSGKSTFLKFIALTISRAKLENDPSLAEAKLDLRLPLPVPIFISLWDLSDYVRRIGKAADNLLIRYIVEQFASFSVALSLSDAQTLIASGECCLLFDGLDEVPTEDGRAQISRLVERFVQEYQDNRYVLTSRVRGYTGGAILRGDFRRCDIQDFDESDIQRFARNWICALLSVSTAELDKPDSLAYKHYNALVRAVSAERVRALAVNPLLMTVIAIVHWNRKRLPEQRVELYDECIDVLLGQRKEAEHKTVGLADREIEKQRQYERRWTRKRFAEIALAILLQEQEEEITKQHIVEILAQSFSDRTDSKEQAQIEAELFLDQQELRSGLLVSRRSRSYRFVHLTFQEYLAAWGLCGRSEYWSIVQPLLREQKWFETLQLLGGEFAQSSDDQLCDYLDRLLGEMGPSISSRAPIVALCANIVHDTQGVANLQAKTREAYEAALRSTLGAFSPEAKIPEKIQREVLEALVGLGKAVKDHLISATKSQYRTVRSRAVELLCPHLPDDDLFSMTHVFKDKSKETIKTYLRALVDRDEARTSQMLQSIEQPTPKSSESLAELRLLHLLPTFEGLLSWYSTLEDYLVGPYVAEIIRRDEVRVRQWLAQLLKSPGFRAGRVINSIITHSRLELIDDDALFLLLFQVDDYSIDDFWHKGSIAVAEAALERDETRLGRLLNDSKNWKEPVLQAVAELKRIDLLDDESLFGVIFAASSIQPYLQAAIERDEERLRRLLNDSKNWKEPVLQAVAKLKRIDLLDDESLFGVIFAASSIQPYLQAAVERDEERLNRLLNDSKNWKEPVLQAVAELKRIDLLDDEGLFGVIFAARYSIQPYLQAAIERDETRLGRLLNDSKNWKEPVLQAVAELKRIDLLDDESLFGVIFAARYSIQPYLQAAIERDETRLGRLLNDSKNWKEPVLQAVAELKRIDLLNNESLLSMIPLIPNIIRQGPRRWLWQHAYWGGFSLDGMLLVEAYRRDRDKTLALLESAVQKNKMSEEAQLLAAMLASEGSACKTEWLIAARLVDSLDLLTKFSDGTIVKVMIASPEHSFWANGHGRINTGPFCDPVVKRRFVGIARRIIELGHGAPDIEAWLKWAIQGEEIK